MPADLSKVDIVRNPSAPPKVELKRLETHEAETSKPGRAPLPSPSELFDDPASGVVPRGWPPPRTQVPESAPAGEPGLTGLSSFAREPARESWEGPLAALERMQGGTGGSWPPPASASWPPPAPPSSGAPPAPPQEGPVQTVPVPESEAPARGRKKQGSSLQVVGGLLAFGAVFCGVLLMPTKKASGPDVAVTPSRAPISTPSSVESPPSLPALETPSPAPDAQSASPLADSSPSPEPSASLPEPTTTPAVSASASPLESPTPQASAQPLATPTEEPTPVASDTPEPVAVKPSPSPKPKPTSYTVKVGVRPKVGTQMYLVQVGGSQRYFNKGMSSLGVSGVKPGTYRLKLQAPGYKTLEQKVEIRANRNLAFALEKLPEPKPVARPVEPVRSYQPPVSNPRPYVPPPPRYSPPPRPGGHSLNQNL